MNRLNLIFSLIFLSSFTSLVTYAQDAPIADSSEGDKIFSAVEKEASFPGGLEGWRKFLQQNLHPDVPVDNGAPAGRYTVMVRFIVGRDGTISDIRALTNEGYGMEQEVIRIIKKSGAWTPAYQAGRNVKAYRQQPVTFVVQDDQLDIITKTPYTLYTGIDNEMVLKVDRVKDGDLQLTIPGGSITSKGDGNYTIRVSKPGRVILSIFNTKKKKPVGSVSFEVVNGNK